MKLPHALRTLRKFGRERLNGNDFIELIRSCGIELTLSADVEKGYYYYSDCGRHVIVLSTHIGQAERAQVGWHEFGHFLQNFLNPRPMRADYCTPENRTPAERFADLFAFVCVTGVGITGRTDFLQTLMKMGHDDE